MESINFIDLTWTTSLILFLVGFVGGMVSGFIGSGGAFVLTPAMMSMGVPGVVAVASNMAHKFPKALVGAHKRHKYGQVDIKLGVVMGIFAEAGVLFGKHVMVDIREAFGAAGTNLYVSVVFVIVLGIVGAMVLRDGMRERRGESVKEPQTKELSSPGALGAQPRDPRHHALLQEHGRPGVLPGPGPPRLRDRTARRHHRGRRLHRRAGHDVRPGPTGARRQRHRAGHRLRHGPGRQPLLCPGRIRGHPTLHDHPGRVPLRHPDRGHRDHLCEGLSWSSSSWPRSCSWCW